MGGDLGLNTGSLAPKSMGIPLEEEYQEFHPRQLYISQVFSSHIHFFRHYRKGRPMQGGKQRNLLPNTNYRHNEPSRIGSTLLE